MAFYYRVRQNEFQSILGMAGVSIDMIVNSAEAKLLVSNIWKIKQYQARQEIQRQERAHRDYIEWLERHLGESLRHFFEFGNWFSITKSCRRYAEPVIYALLFGYLIIWTLFSR